MPYGKNDRNWGRTTGMKNKQELMKTAGFGYKQEFQGITTRLKNKQEFVKAL
jgi:hypothetical protein